MTNNSLTKTPPIRIATYKSDLALWQANWVKAELAKLGHEAGLVLIDTLSDQNQVADVPFAALSGQSLFTKSLQEAVLARSADIAVHSFEDLPSLTLPGLELAAVTKRADARDVLLIKPQSFEPDSKPLPLKKGATVGTNAVRRQAQLKQLRPDITAKELHGNVLTRVQKLRSENYDAIFLAAAGLEWLKLDLSGLEVIFLDTDIMMPAPAQGALALEIRRDDYELASILTDLHDIVSFKAVAAERGIMAMMEAGCQPALGAYATFEAGIVTLGAWYEGEKVSISYPSSEGAAMLAFEALGRPKNKTKNCS